MDSPLAKARKDRNWSQARLILQLRLSGRAAGITLPADSTLRVMLSRWENGQHRPSEMYIGLLCDALEVTGADLGLAVPTRTSRRRSALRRSRISTRCSSCIPVPTTRWALGW
jgi:transcriptional regulator with XRE-family HTH domain